jgi:phosphomannomutase
MQVDPSIFKAYDIRGVYPDQLNEVIAHAIGRAFVTHLEPAEVVIGRDMRLSSPRIFAAVVEGVRQQGADVVDIGMVSTDQFYFAAATLDRPGIMVTASHNPAHYSGLKMVRKMPHMLSGDGIQDLRRLVEGGADRFTASATRGAVVERDMSDGFVAKALSFVEPREIAPLVVVADTCNGMVGPVLTRVFEQLPVELTGMFLEPDGRLPNHGLDPMQEENRTALQEAVVRLGADVGFAFDGDGDRFFVIDDRGQFVPGDFLTALMGCYLLEGEPGGKIIYDVRCSWAVPDLIEAAGGVALIERVGHAFMKPRMADEGAMFAGEFSGHYYFRDFFGADTGIVPALVLLEMLSRKKQKLSQLLSSMEQQYFLSWEINSQVADPLQKIEQLAAHYASGRLERIDGISVSFDDWHFNVRPSNTEPLLRLNLEGRSKELMEEKLDEVLSLIRS